MSDVGIPEGFKRVPDKKWQAVTAEESIQVFALPWEAGYGFETGSYMVAVNGVTAPDGGRLIVAIVPHQAIADYLAEMHNLILRETEN